MSTVTSPLYDRNSLVPSVDPQFARKPTIMLLRAAFAVLSAVSPASAARLGLQLFLTPPRYETPNREIAIRVKAAVSHLSSGSSEIVTYAWGKGPTVLFAHSWGGRGTQVAAFVEPLIQAGYRVVSFDGPAHGASSGKQTDMIEFAAAIKAVADTNGPPHAVIGHSFGAANTLLAIRDHGLAPKKVVMIGCFAHGVWVIDSFGILLNIPNRIIEQMRLLLEQRYDGRLRWESLSLVEMAQNVSAHIMLVHDKDDREIPYAHALAIHAGTTNSRLKTTTGYGHRRILRNTDVIQDVISFIRE